VKNFQLDQIDEALNMLEGAVIRNGVPKKHLMDIKAARQAVTALRKKAEKNELR